MIEWLLSGAGAFIKLMKIWCVIISFMICFGLGAVITDYLCRRFKKWIYRRKRRSAR